jgi:thymidylate kinase
VVGLSMPSAGPSSVEGAALPLDLVLELCQALGDAGIRYCHWKSNEAIDRSATGENDLDLLIERADAQPFGEVLHRLGFKEARPSVSRQVPGLVDHYGFDAATGRLAHLQAHFQLVLGDDMTKNFRLPIERAYLISAAQGPVFCVPSPEMELAVFVVRMVLKHSSWDAQLCGQGRLTSSERRELAYLAEQVPADRLAEAVDQHLPFLPADLFQACLSALEPGTCRRARASAARRLERSLAPHARRARRVDIPLKVGRRCARALDRHVLRRRARRRLATGGALIAVVGSDGSGKSTVVDHLASWLGSAFPVETFHLGKPPRSLASRLVRNAMRAGRLLGLFPATRLPAAATRPDRAGPADCPGPAWLLWHVLNARDRRRCYARARRHATNGGIAICDRFPLPELTLMDGSRTSGLADDAGGWWQRSLVGLERRCYASIGAPDILVVLRVDPDVAARRRPEQDAELVRSRVAEVALARWPRTALRVDANRPQADVLDEVRRYVWARL